MYTKAEEGGVEYLIVYNSNYLKKLIVKIYLIYQKYINE